MRISRCLWVSVIVVAAVVPLMLGARRVPQEEEAASRPVGRGVLLATASIAVSDEVTALKQLVTIPDGARWARIKNVSPVILYLTTTSTTSANQGWPVGPGEQIAFSLESDVYVRTAAGTLSAPVLIGR
jgi:hypothetical protein